MAKKMVYLSGMMDGVSIEEGNAWRLKAATFFRNAGWEVYNPYDGKPADKSEHHKFTPNEIMHRDVYFLDKSDIVLVNLDLPATMENKKIPFFTIGEMYLAHRDRKPIIAYTNCLQGRAGYEAIVTRTLPDLDTCMNYIVENF
jgi:nucleoside 2-deoxyribosyltransferase